MPVEPNDAANPKVVESGEQTGLGEDRKVVELDQAHADNPNGDAANAQPNAADEQAAVEEVVERVKKAGFRVELGRAADVLRDFAWVIERQHDRIATAEADAKIGRNYKAELIGDALSDGVRARGDKFARDKYEKILSGLDIDDIKMMRDEWKAEGDALFPGGRQSVENGEPPEETPKTKRTKNADRVYAG